MGKKKTGAMPTSAPKQKKKMVIDMTKVELAKAYQAPGFRTGKHMTAKDRPRKKDWKREYEKEKGSGRFSGGSSKGGSSDDRTGSFLTAECVIPCDRITIPGRNKFSIKFPEKSLKRIQKPIK